MARSEHGTNSRYMAPYHCRCDKCRAAHAESARLYRADPAAKKAERMESRLEILTARIRRDMAEVAAIKKAKGES